MATIKIYSHLNMPSDKEALLIATLLHQHLEVYGDPIHEIQMAMDYALKKNGKLGGLILTSWDIDELTGATIINKTGMNGYIPDNILVYIATHSKYRGKGIGRLLMQEAIRHADGDIALHVEADNPARNLYESLGFTNKYLEMRLKK